MTLEDKNQKKRKIQGNYRKVIHQNKKANSTTKREIFISSLLIFLFAMIYIMSGPGF